MYSRLNYLRFYFAFSVVAYHTFFDLVPQAGTLAVLGFFFISGFLISQLLSETYAGRPLQFIKNRLLRIYPAYLASALIGITLIYLMPDAMRATNPALYFPEDAQESLDNLFIFGLLANSSRIVPPAWSLDIELRWYIILFVLSFLGPRLRNTILFGFIAVIGLYIYPEKHQFYRTVIGSGFAFSTGALFFHYRPKFNQTTSLFGAICLVPYMFILPHLLGTATGSNSIPYNWVVLIGFIPVMWTSFNFFLVKTRVPRNQDDLEAKKNISISRFFGALSYPVFLTHYFASALCLQFFSIPKNTMTNFMFTIVVTMIVASCIVLFVEKPLETIRTRIRRTNQGKFQ